MSPTPQKSPDRAVEGSPEKKVRREISAGFIVYRRTQEGIKFLILYHGGDYWNFPKGHIEKEEDALRTAFRETREETGLPERDLQLKRGFKAYERFYFRRGKEGIYKIVIFYLAETRNPVVKVSFEHQGYGWFLFPHAKRVLGKHRDSQKVLQAAYDFLRRGTRNDAKGQAPNNIPRPRS